MDIFKQVGQCVHNRTVMFFAEKLRISDRIFVNLPMALRFEYPFF